MMTTLLSGRRLFAAVLSALLLAVGITMVMPSAQASAAVDQSNPDTSTWRPGGGITYAMERVGDTIIFGGTFTYMESPAGETAGRRHLAAISATTGELLDWNPRPDGNVYTVQPTTGGSGIYVGGSFDTIAGVSRANLALITADTGAVLPFRADTNASVLDLELTDGSLFAVGNFWKVENQERGGGAELDPSTGDLRAWNPRTNYGVNSLYVAPDQNSVYIGGYFTTVSDQPRDRMARVDRSSGELMPWESGSTCNDEPNPCIVYDIAGADDAVYLAIGGPGGRVTALDADSGRELWWAGGDGDVQTLAIDADKIYVGGHFETSFSGVERAGMLVLDRTVGAVLPDFTAEVLGDSGIWQIMLDPDRIHIAGQFQEVDGDTTVRKYTSFALLPDPPDTEAPSMPGSFRAPTALADSVSLSWAVAPDNIATIYYEVIRDGEPIAVSPTTRFKDQSVAPETEYTYNVVAYDAAGNASEPSKPVTTTTQPDVARLVERSAEWTYKSDGEAPASGWTELGFDDSNWATGTGEFGYGDGDETTYIAPRGVAHYFRTAFEVADLTVVDSPQLHILLDDGAVVYLNGEELTRINIADGPVTNDTLTESGISGTSEMTYHVVDVAEASLHEGSNQLAVEVHNISSSSSDISMDAFIVAARAPDAPTGLVGQAVDQTSIDLTWDDVPGAVSYSLSRDGEVVSETITTNTFTDRGLAPDTSYSYELKVRTSGGTSPASDPVSVATLPLEVRALVSSGDDWVYNDSGLDLGPVWMTPAYEDSSWAVGPGQFGFGEGDEATVFDYGPNSRDKYLAYYIRTSFDLGTSPSSVAGLTLRAIVDDGAAVYLNGIEIWRINLAADAGYDTPAITFVAGPGEKTWHEIDIPAEHLVAGPNTLAVEIHNNNGKSSDISLDVELDATLLPDDPAAVGAPLAPAGLVGVVSDTSVVLSWEVTADADSYAVARDGVEVASGLSGLTFTDSGLSPDTGYTYEVTATGPGGTGPAAQVLVTTDPAAVGAPLAPAGLVGVVSDTSVVLSWEVTADADSYAVARDGVEVASGLSGLTFTDSGLSPDTGYTYEVTATGPGGTGPAAQVLVTTDPAAVGAPLAPAGLVGVVSDTSVVLSWEVTADADSYAVARDGVEVASGLSGLTFTDSGLSPDTGYTYEVTATGPGGTGPAAQVLVTTDPAAVGAPLAPAGLVGVVSDTSVVLSWEVTADADSYAVARDGVEVASGLSGLTFTDSGLSPDTGYTYEVTATGPGGTGPAAQVLVTTDPAAVGAPLAPAGLVGVVSDTSVVLSWEVTADADSYAVARDGVEVASGVSGLTFTDSGLSPDTGYTYEVTATGPGGTGPAAQVLVTTDPAAVGAPLAPAGLVGVVSDTSVVLSWEVTADADSYAVARDGVEVASGVSGLTFTDSGLSPDTGYTYEVTATGPGGTGPAAQVLVTTDPAAPAVPAQLVASGDSWKYETSGAESTDWDQPGFDDSTWAAGISELGHYDGDEATEITPFADDGTTRRITTYFRTTFDVDPAATIAELGMRVKRDDGVVVYLNGKEIWRDNMPTGPIGENTAATTWAPDDGTTWQNSDIATTDLVDGQNTIAVEVHQSSASSKDLSFNLELEGKPSAEAGLSEPAAPTGPVAVVTGETSVDLSWNEVAGATSYSVYRDGTKVSTDPATSFSDTGLSPGQDVTYTVTASNDNGESTQSADVSVTTDTPAPVGLVASGDSWKYETSGAESTDWDQPGFDDSTWAAGISELGHYDGDEATEITPFADDGTTRRITTYFRTTFDVDSAATIAELGMRVKRDDGVVVYLNGKEIWRDNMPTGPIGENTKASTWAPDDGTTWQNSNIATTDLVDGQNTIAVEVHQSSASSKDLSFNLELEGKPSAEAGLSEPAAPTGPVAVVTGETSVDLSWNEVAGATSYSVYRDGTKVSTDPATSFSDTGLSPGQDVTYTVTASNDNGESTQSADVSVTTDTPAPVGLVASGDSWKYETSGAESTDWDQPGFDDSTWAAGISELGHYDGDEATEITPFADDGTTRRITTYFRTTFDVDPAATIAELGMRVKRDDGVVVYLNGKEIWRDNMPTGPIGDDTAATTWAPDDGTTWQNSNIATTDLVDGQNTIAVEVHQSSASSKDLSFNLELEGRA